jgi:protein SCO1/2
LTQAVGFRYAYEAETEQFAHAAGLVVLTPQGQIARYLYGLEFAPKALRLALVEASAGQIASAVDQLLLFCYKYDPTTGKYGLVIMNVLRLAGLMTVTALGGFMIVMFGRERKRVV